MEENNSSKRKNRIRFIIIMAILFCASFAVFYFYNRAKNGGMLHGDTDTGSAVVEKMNVLNELVSEKFYFQNQYDIETIREGAYKGIVDALGDDYSTYRTKEETERYMLSKEGKLNGIGVYLSNPVSGPYVRISGLMANSPAEEAGLEIDDTIIEIDGESAWGMSTDAVAEKMSGETDTDVTLLIQKDATGEKKEYTITRKLIDIISVFHEEMEDEIGYIRITRFTAETDDAFQEAYEELMSKEIKGLILDLRGNMGGNVNEACLIADMLLPKGRIAYTKSVGEEDITYESDANEITIPMAVLIDTDTASSGELLSAAIKHYKKGTLIGTTTYGKGIVQRIYELTDGSSVGLTISEYFGPGGETIHKIGVEPDIILKYDADLYEEAGIDNQVAKAKEVLRDLRQE